MENHDDNPPLIDGLDELPRGSLNPPDPPDWLRKSVFDRTTRLVRRRRRRRWLQSAAAFVLVYAAGLGTASLLERSTVPAGEAIDRRGDDAPRVTGTASSTADDPSGDAVVPRAAGSGSASPSELLRRVARARPGEQRRLLKLAGDTYLESHADVERALYCYRQLLEITPQDKKAVPEPDDSWLLAALKQGLASI